MHLAIRTAAFCLLTAAMLLAGCELSGKPADKPLPKPEDEPAQELLQQSATGTAAVLRPRAEAAAKDGLLQIVPLGPEKIAKLGAPSCLGKEEDVTIRGDYEVRFTSKDGRTQILDTLRDWEIIQPRDQPLKPVKLDFPGMEAYYFMPRYSDCHGVEFRVYGIRNGEAALFEFQTGQGVFKEFTTGMEPDRSPRAQDGQLAVTGGYAAGMDGVTVYYFEPQAAAARWVLTRTERKPL
ncbi:hypothetical protein O9H85_33300 [Paenibacillus filicis]|uniref:Lipoprotein n=1 Tax=Paenibacillus gyeongsangnamensis TaxID=3388067 RepID=A0ABT4QJY1_9BACL|nr:hypothetical protein [Paenibacillus filicis]MCZ8517145.1 hypothetical protein [Paenibacillus filicis]